MRICSCFNFLAFHFFSVIVDIWNTSATLNIMLYLCFWVVLLLYWNRTFKLGEKSSTFNRERRQISPPITSEWNCSFLGTVIIVQGSLPLFSFVLFFLNLLSWHWLTSSSSLHYSVVAKIGARMVKNLPAYI